VKIFGIGSVKQISKKHEIFHNVYNLGDKGLPYIQGQQHGAEVVYFAFNLLAKLACFM